MNLEAFIIMKSEYWKLFVEEIDNNQYIKYLIEIIVQEVNWIFIKSIVHLPVINLS